MRGLRSLAWWATVFAIVIVTAQPAAAQLTTGSLAGVVKDAQGGVIPGATVTLVSETRATRSVPIVTNATGDFVRARILAGHVRACHDASRTG